MQSNKPDKNIKAKLFSADTATVVSALNSLKEEGNVSYLPILFDLLNSNPETEIEKEIIYILSNLKIKEAAPVMVEALQAPGYDSIRKKLTTACWQNGLDYKEFFPVFVDLVIQEDWETGFEAFTVIENMETFPGREVLDPVVDEIHKALKDAGEQKRYFLHEILVLIR
ncbi:hypothetical protein D1164_06265 [Mariniphaga sediminis]|jgi:hypothetical protein|uniref:HEAT repeat domain-containing protein n=2 Tax=Mariniphaga sediminis TaxID=1628158 RepID=A0A399D2K8_9BACT|nr:hypothetical protein [Mariniphaga sediminis]RIH65869.1 hypothetical protein D1164_06265 [Mariniphaga sediminis]